MTNDVLRRAAAGLAACAIGLFLACGEEERKPEPEGPDEEQPEENRPPVLEVTPKATAELEVGIEIGSDP